MKGSVSVRCIKCGSPVETEGVRAEGAGEDRVMCTDCLGVIYPEGKEMPVAMDKDGNLYFIDKSRNAMVIFFAYGEAPYSACTEVNLEEEECGCGFSIY
jgi:hypothetical protein